MVSKNPDAPTQACKWGKADSTPITGWGSRIPFPLPAIGEGEVTWPSSGSCFVNESWLRTLLLIKFFTPKRVPEGSSPLSSCESCHVGCEATFLLVWRWGPQWGGTTEKQKEPGGSMTSLSHWINQPWGLSSARQGFLFWRITILLA